MTTESDVPRQKDPQAQLEQSFIDEFVRGRGHDPALLHQMPDDERRALLREACIHASARLAEVDCRAHYIHEIHGQ
jgi:hypothetical protein